MEGEADRWKQRRFCENDRLEPIAQILEGRVTAGDGGDTADGPLHVENLLAACDVVRLMIIDRAHHPRHLLCARFVYDSHRPLGVAPEHPIAVGKNRLDNRLRCARLKIVEPSSKQFDAPLLKLRHNIHRHE